MSGILTTGLVMGLCNPVMAADEGTATVAAKVTLPKVTEITSIDFNETENLEAGSLDGWKVSAGGGTAELVTDDSKGKVLKLSRTKDGGETGLVHESLGIQESEYRYVTVETELKLGTEGYERQFGLPYIADSDNNTVYAVLTDGDWTEYKGQVNGKNPLAAGSAKKGEWQNIRMDIDLKTDTYRLAVDGEYILVGVNARAKATNLNKIKYYADSWNRGTLYMKSVKITGQTERTESTTFYVSNAGDDSADGQSEATAWATLDRVNQEHFIPGDKILFQRDGIWENQTLQPQGSGNEDAKIVIGNYGEGEMPQIAANGKMADALYLCNQQYWEISGLDVSNTVEGFTMVTNGEIPTGNVKDRVKEQGEKLGDFRGIHIAGRDVASLKGFHLHDLKVHDVTGHVAWIGNTGLNDAGIVNNAGLDGSKRTGGVLIECLSPTGNQPTQFSDIVIEDSEFINNSFCGITIKQWNGSGNQYSENPGWANRNGSGGAPDYVDSNWYPHSNILIQNNYVNQGASAYACNGIYLTSSKDSVIQNNVLEHIGTCGIELYFTDNVAVQYNEVSDVVKKCGGADDNAIDPDWRVTNALIQYNYVHDCGEGFLLCGVQFNSGVIRYNLVQDCGRSYIHYSMGSGYFQLYNNVFYRSAEGNGTNNFDPWGGGTATYFNNVFYDAKKAGFNFSGGTNFSYYNNAYYGVNPPSKEKNAIILEEEPFEGTAPSLDRKGNFATGVLLEANGLRPKQGSPLIAAGVVKDANGYSIEDGLQSRGSKFNFMPLVKANTEYFGGCINIDRIDYPTFALTGTDATFGTEKSQQAASAESPTIGMFEVLLDENAVPLRGKVSDGLNPLAGAEVTVQVGEKSVTTITNESGVYSILEGLKAGEATITVTQSDGRTETVTVTLEAGKVNVADVKVALIPMPDAYEYTIIDENFDDNASDDFVFNKGAEFSNGKLVIMKGMGNNASAVSEFDTQVAGQKGVDFSFDWSNDWEDKGGFEFRDSYGRLLFAVCASNKKSELRTSTTGGAVDADRAASQSEPVWSAVRLETGKVYTIRVHVDFEKKLISYQVKEKDGDILVQQLDVPTDAVNLAQMNLCSWYASAPHYIDNFVMTALEKEIELPLEGKTVYAFGDSIVAGHQYQKGSFVDFVANKEAMKLQKFAVNGATILDAQYSGGQIRTQVENAPVEAPDFVLFDGGTNDAEYIKNNQDISYGTVGEETEEFDTATFAGAFEQLVSDMKQKWPEAQLIYTAVHKLGSRDNEVQEKMHEIEMQICEKWDIAVANVYEDAELDTNDVNQKNAYTFDGVASNGLPGINGSGTHPNFAAIEEFYLPIVSAAFRNPTTPVIPDSVDKSGLEILYNANKEKADEGYTTGSWTAFQNALTAAKAVLDNADVTQDEVNAQITALQAAVDGLQKATDTTSLEEAVAEAKAEAAKTEAYTEESIAVLNQAIQDAEKALENEDITEETVAQHVEELLKAVNALVGKADKAALNEKLAEAKEKAAKTDVYTAESIAAIQTVIDAAQNVAAQKDASQGEVDAQVVALQAAIDTLVEIPTPPVEAVDKEALNAVIAAAEKETVAEDKYTLESLSALKQAIAVAKAVVENQDASQEEVDAQVVALQAAIDALQLQQNPGSDGEGGCGDASNTGTGSNTPENTGKQSVKTGDAANWIPYGITMLFALAAILVVYKRKYGK